MNITEFAEQIVFGTTLEEKLASPGRLSYDSAGSPRLKGKCFDLPGRPAGMQMQPAASIAVPPPSDDQLENEHARGQLLHRLANHELLATELMALVLLKFPDAPIPFRRGVLVTLQEEQEHTRMYLKRMQECGVEFGEHPLSGQFWRIVAPMESPMDFVSQLSLTFEQANLDYSQHFAKVFKRIGDDETSALLQQVYEDEIGHVQHGLEWFRQWKDPSQSDWEAYQQSLDFPMSPQRARGPKIDFNREGRLRAGLDKEFVDSVEVFRQSRGKAATLRWFDLGAESELAGQQSTKELALLTQLGRDLEMVLLPMSKPDDVLLVRDLPSKEILKHWIDAGLSLPEFQSYEYAVDELAQRCLHDFAPWAWTPKSHGQAQPLVEVTRHEPPVWQEKHVDLFRKSWSVNQLRKWLSANDPLRDTDLLADASTVGVTIDAVEDVTAALENMGRDGYAKALVKHDLGTSGRGQREVACDAPITNEDQRWIRSAFKHGPCVVEPLLDRVLDLSFLWRLERGEAEAKFVGWTRPIVTQGRRYAGARLGDLFSDCDVEVRKSLLANRCQPLRTIATWLEERVIPQLRAAGFEGPFGVDAIAYRDLSGRLRVKPMVELNPRTTMGHAVLALGKRLAPGVRGEFRILSRTEWDEFSQNDTLQPVTLNQQGKWTSGVVRLSEVVPATKLVPLVVIGSKNECR